MSASSLPPRLTDEELSELERLGAAVLAEDSFGSPFVKGVCALIAEVRRLRERETALADENEKLITGLLLVRSMPTTMNDERHGYDCAGCGAALGAHTPGCPWERAMQILRDRRAGGSE